MSQQPEQAAPLTLQILPDGNERVFDGTRRVVIGRDPNQADVIVAEPRASRIHATLVRPGRRMGPGGLLQPGHVRAEHPPDAADGAAGAGGGAARAPGGRPGGAPGARRACGRTCRLPDISRAARLRSPDSAPQPGYRRHSTSGSAGTPRAARSSGPQATPGLRDQALRSSSHGRSPRGSSYRRRPYGNRPAQQPWAQQPGAVPQATPYIPQQIPAQQPQQPRLGEYTGVYQTSNTLRIGRDATNDIVLHDLQASRFHAELQFKGGRFEIVDKGSHNGTYLNGVRINRAEVREGAIIAIARHLLRFHNGELQEFVDTGGITFSAANLGVLAGPKVLLDNVSFALEGGDFLAVLGPTGAGKSTLMKALTGNRPADRGAVFYNGRDLYANYAELRNRVGYVPQDDILHPQLKVRDALRYAAQLRFPPDVPASDRNHRVEEVMAELGLTERGDLAVEKLSGGQRKRTSVAIELLTRPEPADPGRAHLRPGPGL